MSVYTKITDYELTEHLINYSIGEAHDLIGISDGIENTNYLLKTQQNEYIFTIFENIGDQNINQYLEFMNHLSNKGLLCPNVIKSNANTLFVSIKGKPSAIIEKLDGKSITNPDINHCGLIGDLLAKFHNYGSGFETHLTNSRDLTWCQQAYKKLAVVVSTDQSNLIRDAILIQKEMEKENLPIGTIHADLFKDNVLFNNDNVSGMIDFYYSCSGFLIYDLAVVMNDWCSDKEGVIIEAKANNLISSYNKNREIQNVEKIFWNHALISASLRFFLSRLLDLHYPKIGEMTHIKDPKVFENILTDRMKKSYVV